MKSDLGSLMESMPKPKVTVFHPNVWSGWHDVIVPNPVPGQRDADYVERVSIGYRMKSEHLERLFLEYPNGDYEWRKRKGNETRVIGVGETGSLYERIKDYCQNGSDKAVEFDTALQNGYTLDVRVKYVSWKTNSGDSPISTERSTLNFAEIDDV